MSERCACSLVFMYSSCPLLFTFPMTEDETKGKNVQFKVVRQQTDVKSSQRLTHCVLGSMFCVLCSGGLTQKPNCWCLFSVSFMFTFRVKLKDSFIGLAEIWISPLHKTARSSTLLNKNGAPSPPTPTTTTWQLDYCCDFQKCAAWIIISLWNASGPYAN